MPQVHLIVDAVLDASATITLRPASGKIGKFWYAKAASGGVFGSKLEFIGESGTKELQAYSNAWEWGEQVFAEATNYQKFELILDYDNYLKITNGNVAGTYSVYWVET